MTSPEPPAQASLAAQVAAQNLRVDAVTAEVLRAFEEAGAEALLLKGPSFARWLYGAEEVRGYADCDLLVADAALPQARRALEALGFAPAVDEEHMPGWWRDHAVEWQRPADAAGVDIHRTLAGVGVGAPRLWETLSRRVETITVGGFRARMLDEPARAFHVALHAAQHGWQGGRAQRDLERALDVLDARVWREAADVASALEATPAFTAGLMLKPAGRATAEELGLPTDLPVDVILRTMSAPPLALGFDQLARAAGLRERLEILRYKLVPPPTFMRVWSPVAREGRAGLARAYVARIVWLARSAPAGFRAWRAARGDRS